MITGVTTYTDKEIEEMHFPLMKSYNKLDPFGKDMFGAFALSLDLNDTFDLEDVHIDQVCKTLTKHNMMVNPSKNALRLITKLNKFLAEEVEADPEDYFYEKVKSSDTKRKSGGQKKEWSFTRLGLIFFFFEVGRRNKAGAKASNEIAKAISVLFQFVKELTTKDRLDTFVAKFPFEYNLDNKKELPSTKVIPNYKECIIEEEANEVWLGTLLLDNALDALSAPNVD